MFSTRVPAERKPSRFARALAAARGRSGLLDLTLTNPTQAGIAYPEHLLDVLASPESLAYRPEPLGLERARDAIGAIYRNRGIHVGRERIVLTASTSEAYSILFKLLCDPGRGDVLTPVPSYPLFDHLARLDGVRQRRYPLEYDGAWSIDLDALDRVWTSATRAVLTVSPNNPTGSVLHDRDAAELAARSAARDAALIVDEVFWEYPLDAPLPEAAALRGPACLVARLGGLSKLVGLPQLKLGWIAIDGPDDLVAEAIDRLELIADTYLSVATPVQIAAPALLEAGADVRARILQRVRANYATLRRLSAASSIVTTLPADGGWSAVMRVPATGTEDDLVMDLLERDGVVAHPGYFFDFPHEAFLVVSLLPGPEVFAEGIARVLERLHAA